MRILKNPMHSAQFLHVTFTNSMLKAIRNTTYSNTINIEKLFAVDTFGKTENLT